MAFDASYVKSVIRALPDWPEPGVTFRDITPIFKDPKALRTVTDGFIERYVTSDITHIASIDARGFLVSAILAHQLNKPLILVRKKGKLPGDTISQSYDLEYGSATLEVQTDACGPGDKVLIFDDLIATGGTLIAACSLVQRLGGSVSEVASIIDLPGLQGSQRLQDSGVSVFSLIAY
ncbi:adenine phosphoribosyltransferase [Pokkaliibacter plantistimulans]|uniref:Adenine phosphoribosyltransferase n=2 Tax=Pseudomonadota TaxID=1224 RepID=A0ABX5LUY6_9GAMM|nr:MULTISPECIES: adenine phosphoribosyltransferase [Pokkaliibacter]MDH2435105.1 adenine phosphoribosyltransferase [Pokkaliibacter sp. MBI-7]PPC77223.1 adenine phosphoribosyltransferase [Pokkaliibacter plantistimulans]PXF30487.1 adenine phosphoribosyltransferase [Pokkaliibacter plantistimulans]